MVVVVGVVGVVVVVADSHAARFGTFVMFLFKLGKIPESKDQVIG